MAMNGRQQENTGKQSAAGKAEHPTAGKAKHPTAGKAKHPTAGKAKHPTAGNTKDSVKNNAKQPLLKNTSIKNSVVIARFFSVFLVLYFLTTSIELEPLKKAVAATVHFFVSIVEPKAALAGTSILFGGFDFSIIQLCTGVVSMSIFAALILTYPSTSKEKILSIAFLPVIFFFNALRISVVILSSGMFEKDTVLFLHEQTWVLTAFFVLFCWYLFLNKTEKISWEKQKADKKGQDQKN